MQNLIGNGIKYQDEDRTPRVEISFDDRDREWVVIVKDNGIGIKESYFEKIFEIFERLHTAEEFPGTGIGLALCKRIVLSYRGSIGLESQLGVGSKFFFSIPKYEEREESQA